MHVQLGLEVLMASDCCNDSIKIPVLMMPCTQATGASQQQQQPAAASKQQPQQQAHKLQQQKPQGQHLSGSKRPAPAAAAGAADGDAAADAAVPKGFFDSKAADDAARGIKQ